MSNPFKSKVTASDKNSKSTATFGSPSLTHNLLAKTNSIQSSATKTIKESSTVKESGVKPSDKLRRTREERQKKPVNVDTSIMMFAEQASLDKKRGESPTLMYPAPASLMQRNKSASGIRVFQKSAKKPANSGAAA